MASTALTTLQNTKNDIVPRIEKKVPIHPSTPSRLNQAASQTPSPGQWRHPKLAELARRQKRNTFDSSNIWTILANGVAILITWQWRDALWHISPSITSWEYWLHVEGALTALFLYNIYRASRPAWRVADNVPDVDLTAGQRALLGLDPTATPPETPGTRYLTPPKYAASARGTPSTGSSVGSAISRAASFGSSTRPTPSPASSTRSVSGSSLLAARDVPSPSGNLWQRKVGGPHGYGRRRSSLGGARDRAGSGSGSPQVPTYGDRDAWLLSTGGTPPRREEWRFMTSGAGTGATAATATAATVAAGSPGASRNSPLGRSLEGTGLWGASTGSSAGLGGSVFRPDTPSPVGRGASVPLTSRWVYARGREGAKF